MSSPDGDLQALAARIRRQPALARDMDVSALAQEVASHWRAHSDMVEASEEVPIAAWIVRRKVEGLVRPDEEDPEPEPFDPDKRPAWLMEAVEQLKRQGTQGNGRWVRPDVPAVPRPPAPVKEPSVWKLAWSYPPVREPKRRPQATVTQRVAPLRDHLDAWLKRLAGGKPVYFHDVVDGQSRDHWAVSFLAAVHLWHQRTIDVQQTEVFGPLRLQKTQP